VTQWKRSSGQRNLKEPLGRIGDVDNEEAADVFDPFRNSGLLQEAKYGYLFPIIELFDHPLIWFPVLATM
jgi:hypothetical protein